MKFIKSLILLFVFCIISFQVQAQTDCYPVLPKAVQQQSLTHDIDNTFGKVVGVLSDVLFWEPITVPVVDAEGHPVYKTTKVKDAGGKSLSQVHLVYQAADNPKVHEASAACLNKKGVVVVDESGNPYFTNWSVQDGAFVHSTAFTIAGKTFLKNEAGAFHKKVSFLEQKSEFQKMSGIPLVVLVLMFGAITYTLVYKFANLRLFKHAIDCVRGVFDNPKAPGEISHFQALTSALSGTVGLGNIAGVAVAVGVGGPGAVFWMVLLGILGMSSKFHECTLGQMYRQIDPDGRVFGGPNQYLSRGFKDLGWAKTGKVLAVIFSIIIIFASIGGGNMFQANQSFMALAGEVPSISGYGIEFGIVLAFLVGLIIIGGIKRIGQVTEKLVPFMVAVYVLASLYIILSHLHLVPGIFSLIFAKAFSFEAGMGGFIGVAVQGIRRAVFSNEAGLGSASFAHSAAKTEEPVREGVVALLEPFIDTVVICTMTALVVLITGAYNNPIAGEGVQMTRYAFGLEIPWFPVVLSTAVFMFALSTMITWAYYGEEAWAFLFGHSKKVGMIYKLIYLVAIVLGCAVSLGNVIDFTDLAFLSLALPNILGGLFLIPKVKKALGQYQNNLKNNVFVRHK